MRCRPLTLFKQGALPLSTSELSRACRPGRTSSGETWNKIVSDWFQQKTMNKSVSDWSFQVRTTAGERAACLACERVFH